MFAKRLRLAPIVFALAATTAANAESYEAPEDVLNRLIEKSGSPYLSQSQQNLMMMADNPAYWTAEEGEELFNEKRGPNNVSLEGCDFGKGPGVVEGAYVEMPRYFADTGRVMDLESRLVHCMTTLQGFDKNDDPVKKRHGSGSDFMKLQTYIAAQSNGKKWNPPMDHPMEKAMRDVGDKVPAGDRTTIERTIEELKSAKEGENVARIRQLTEQLQQASYAIGQQAYAAQQAEAAGGPQPGQGQPGYGQPGQGQPGYGPGGGSGPEDIIDGDFSAHLS